VLKTGCCLRQVPGTFWAVALLLLPENAGHRAAVERELLACRRRGAAAEPPAGRPPAGAGGRGDATGAAAAPRPAAAEARGAAGAAAALPGAGAAAAADVLCARPAPAHGRAWEARVGTEPIRSAPAAAEPLDQAAAGARSEGPAGCPARGARAREAGPAASVDATAVADDGQCSPAGRHGAGQGAVCQPPTAGGADPLDVDAVLEVASRPRMLQWP